MNASETQIAKPRLRDLFTAGRMPATLLLGAGVGIEALEFYVTSSLMPSMVRDIGGLALLAWTSSLFVAAIVLGSREDGKVHLVANFDDSVAERVSASDVVREAAAIVGGGGGGRPTMARAGGKDTEKLPDALARAKELIVGAL